MNFSENILKDETKSDRDYILQVVDSLFLCDVGVVVYVYEREPVTEGEGLDLRNGTYVDVRLTDQSTINSVEYMYIGNKNTAMDTAPTVGDRVICFGMKHSITSIEDMYSQVDVPYKSSFAKCFGLSSIKSSIASMVFDMGVYLQGDLSRVGIGAASEYIKKLGGIVNEVERPDGSFSKSYKNVLFRNRDTEGVTRVKLYDNDTPERKVLFYEETDLLGNVTEYRNELTAFADKWAEKKWGRESHINADGSRTTVVKSAEKLVLLNRNENADGSYEFDLMEQSEDGADYLVKLLVGADGSLDRLQTSDGAAAVNHINIGADGAMTIEVGEGKAAITITPDGGVSFTLEDALTIEAKEVTMKADDITIGDSGNVTLKGTVKIGGTVSPSGSGALCGIPACLFTGAPQCGDTASGA